MTTNPFADAPQGETTADVPAPAPAAVAAAPDKVTVTLKGGSGFEAPWIVHHASSIAEAEQMVRDSGPLMKLAQDAATHFTGLEPAKSAPATPRNASTAAKPAYQQAPGGEGRQCPHGEMVFKSGVSKKDGKPWSAFMCPAPAGTPDQCEKQWLR